MKEQIFKYEIPIPRRDEAVGIELPMGAKIIHVASQHNKPQLWAIVNPEAIKQTRTFEVYGTGFEMDDLQADKSRIHIGTFLLENGIYVFHVFEIIKI